MEINESGMSDDAEKVFRRTVVPKVERQTMIAEEETSAPPVPYLELGRKR